MFELKKIGFVKRASALLLDAILLAVLTTGFMWIISLICHYSREEALANEQYAAWETFREEYIKSKDGKQGIAEYYGFTYEEDENGGYTVSKDGIGKSLDDVLLALDASEGKDEATAEAYTAYKALPPAQIVNAQYRYVYTMLFMMVSIGILLSYLLLEFALPLIFKNGQTIGKKVFGICLVRPDCVKITALSLFARTVLGKFAIETMFPVLLVFLFFFSHLGWLAIVLFAGIILLNVVMYFTSRNRTPIHDLLAGTVAVDMRLQRIYASEEELNREKALTQRELVENSKEQ